uniref:Secreted protein n=1 Tax=Globodera pallida TaxID=36090 RepID=A0A183C9X8_GLOPA
MVRILQLFLVITLIESARQLTCRINAVGNVPGLDQLVDTSRKECDQRSILNPRRHFDRKYIHCVYAVCYLEIPGGPTWKYHWATFYGCSKESDEDTCANGDYGVAYVLSQRIVGGMKMLCEPCELGVKGVDYQNSDRPMCNETHTECGWIPPPPMILEPPETTASSNVLPPLPEPDSGTTIKIGLPVVLANLAIAIGTFFAHPFE